MCDDATSRETECKTSRQKHALLLLGVAGCTLLGSSAFMRPTPLVIYNATASAPIGFYRVLPLARLWRGELVLVHTPASVRVLAARRGYLPADVPLVKRVAALSGDQVCARHHVVTIDGHAVAQQRVRDRLGRPLPSWTGCRLLRVGEVFLLMKTVPDSFDGRYFGPTPARAIIGRLVPLWLG